MIEEFLRVKKIAGKSQATLQKYAETLQFFKKIVGKDPCEATDEEILQFFEYFRNNGYKPNSISSYGRIIKTYLNWCGRDTKKLELPSKVEEVVTADSLLSEEEIQLLILRSKNIRDRALVSVLWESGTRISEFLSLNINSVIPTDYGFDLVIQESKTQKRLIPIVKSASYLAEWLDFHPCKGNGNAPLWVCLAHNIPTDTKLSRVGVELILKNLAKRVGIKKKVHPHLLRHTRLTELSQQVREPVLKAFAGWSPSSNMVSRYVHLSGQDIKENLLAAQGIIPPKPIEFLPLKECPRCKAKNENLNEYCFQCGYPLVKDKPIVVRDLGKINELEAEIEELKKDTEIAIHHAVNQAIEKEAKEWKEKLDKILELIMEGK